MSCGGIGASVWVFFLQAEGGIRDLTVTGVQTCALPIYPRRADPHPVFEDGERSGPRLRRRRRPRVGLGTDRAGSRRERDRKSTRLNSSHSQISYAVFCLKKNNKPIPVHAHLSTLWRSTT